jgi:hypothetical protein
MFIFGSAIAIVGIVVVHRADVEVYIFDVILLLVVVLLVLLVLLVVLLLVLCPPHRCSMFQTSYH